MEDTLDLNAVNEMLQQEDTPDELDLGQVNQELNAEPAGLLPDEMLIEESTQETKYSTSWKMRPDLDPENVIGVQEKTRASPVNPGWLDEAPVLRDFLYGAQQVNDLPVNTVEDMLLAPGRLALGAAEFATAAAGEGLNNFLAAFESVGTAATTQVSDLYNRIFRDAAADGQLSFFNVLQEEYASRLAQHQRMVPYLPQTEVGQAMWKGLGDLMNFAVQGLGDAVYEKTESPAAGAAAQSTVAALMAALGYAGAKKSAVAAGALPDAGGGQPPAPGGITLPVPFRDTQVEDFPQTLARMEGAKVGSLQSGKPMNVVQRFDQGLGAELGLTPEEMVSLTLDEKLTRFFDRLDPQGEIGPNVRASLLQEVEQKLMTLHKLQESVPAVKVRASPGDIKLSDRLNAVLDEARTTPMPAVVRQNRVRLEDPEDAVTGPSFSGEIEGLHATQSPLINIKDPKHISEASRYDGDGGSWGGGFYTSDGTDYLWFAGEDIRFPTASYAYRTATQFKNAYVLTPQTIVDYINRFGKLGNSAGLKEAGYDGVIVRGFNRFNGADGPEQLSALTGLDRAWAEHVIDDGATMAQVVAFYPDQQVKILGHDPVISAKIARDETITAKMRAEFRQAFGIPRDTSYSNDVLHDFFYYARRPGENNDKFSQQYGERGWALIKKWQDEGLITEDIWRTESELLKFVREQREAAAEQAPVKGVTRQQGNWQRGAIEGDNTPENIKARLEQLRAAAGMSTVSASNISNALPELKDGLSMVSALGNRISEVHRQANAADSMFGDRRASDLLKELRDEQNFHLGTLKDRIVGRKVEFTEAQKELGSTVAAVESVQFNPSSGETAFTFKEGGIRRTVPLHRITKIFTPEELRAIEGSVPASKPRLRARTGPESVRPVAPQQPGTATSGAHRGATSSEEKLLALERVYDDADKARADANKLGVKKIASILRQKVFDNAGSVRDALSEFPEGRLPTDKFIAINGAGAKAQQYFLRAAKGIWGDLDKAQERYLDLIIQARRGIQIDTYKGEGKQKRPSKLTGEELRSAMAALEQRLGTADFARLNARADQYFGTFHQLLQRRLDEGLITPQLFDKLKNFDYSPTEYLTLIDPPSMDKLGGVTLNVTDSGVEKLTGGSTERIQKMNARELLADAIGRLEKRAAKNAANQALAEFTRAHPENDWVKFADVTRDGKGEITKVKNPRNWAEVNFWEGGKRKVLLMDNGMAQGWVTQPLGMDPTAAWLFRTASLSTPLRKLAVEYNPAFFIVGAPMDMMHTWWASGTYSMNPLIAAGQLTRDIVTAFPDAIMRGKKTQAYIEEGGGWNFFTHSGTDFFGRKKPVHEQIDNKWRPVMAALSWTNETAELAVRLGHRDRMIREGMTPEQATIAARDRLDYSQGGPASKAGDTVITFLNVALQGYYKVAKQAEKDPVRFTMQATQLAGGVAGLVGANIILNQECWEQVPTRDKINNLILCTGQSTIGADGSKRFVYYKLRVDPTAAPIMAGATASVEKALLGKVPNDLAMKTLGTMPGGIPPSIHAALTMQAEHDFFADRPLWTGANVSPGMRFDVEPKRPTGEIFKWLGQAIDVSPKALEAGTRAVIPNNDYINMLYLTKVAALGKSQYEEAQSDLEWLSKMPIANRVFSLTHPAVNEIEELSESEQTVNDKYQMQMNALQQHGFLALHGKIGEEKVREWVKTQPGEDQQSLMQTWQHMKQLDQNYREAAKLPDMPSKSWWIRTGAARPEVRAEAFFARWREADAGKRAVLERTASRLSGYGSPEFHQHFNRLKKDLQH